MSAGAQTHLRRGKVPKVETFRQFRQRFSVHRAPPLNDPEQLSLAQAQILAVDQTPAGILTQRCGIPLPHHRPLRLDALPFRPLEQPAPYPLLFQTLRAHALLVAQRQVGRQREALARFDGIDAARKERAQLLALRAIHRAPQVRPGEVGPVQPPEHRVAVLGKVADKGLGRYRALRALCSAGVVSGRLKGAGVGDEIRVPSDEEEVSV